MNNMERVKKGEKYWSLVYTSRDGFVALCYADTDIEGDILDFERGNYFADRESAEKMARKLSAVLKGADVIEMPSEEEIRKHYAEMMINNPDYHLRTSADVHINVVDWFKSKIVK